MVSVSRERCYWLSKMKRRRFLKQSLEGILLASTSSILSANEIVIKAETYFPLDVGNSWTYVKSDDNSTKTFTIIGTEEINGHSYYKFDDYWGGIGVREGEEFLFRFDTNRVLMWDSWWYSVHGEEVVRYDFSGSDYWDGANLGACRLKRDGVTCNVPAGEFSNCINFQFLGMDCGPDAYQFGEYLAPNVGDVKYVVPGGVVCADDTNRVEGDIETYELQKYKISGITYIEEEKPTDFYLKTPYPNPFNPSTTIEYSLPQDGKVTLTIFNVSGKVVYLLKDEYQQAGNHSATWDSTRFPSGLYFCILQANGFTQTKKMMLVR